MGDARHAGDLAAAAGIRQIGGFLHGGMTSWRQEEQATSCTERETVEQLHARTHDDEATQILDVRDEKESETGHIPGSMLKTWHAISELPDGIDPGRPVAVICGSGQRAATAASLIERFGAEHVIHIVGGGVPEWARLGYPLELSPAE